MLTKINVVLLTKWINIIFINNKKNKMKNIFIIFLSVISFTGFSQDFKRTEVKGEILVESNDIFGITIFNSSSNIGIITNEKGEFLLDVRLGDVIEVSSLQFQNVKFQVNEDIMASKQMKIFLIDEINTLDEIIVIQSTLSGNLYSDLKKTNRFKPKLDALYFGIKNKDEFEFEKDSNTRPKNKVMPMQQLPMINGLNIVNIVDQLLLPLFRSKAPNKKEKGIPDVPVEAIKYYFGSAFLIDNFNIPEHRVEEFISFAEAGNFDFALLNYGNEMQFLEYLLTKSKEFLKV